MKAQRRNWRYSSTLSLTSALYTDGWSTPRPGRFIPLPIVQEAGWASGSVWMATEMSPIPALEPGTAQPVTISYADYAIPLHKSSVSWTGMQPRRPRWEASNQPSDSWLCTSSFSSYDTVKLWSDIYRVSALHTARCTVHRAAALCHGAQHHNPSLHNFTVAIVTEYIYIYNSTV